MAKRPVTRNTVGGRARKRAPHAYVYALLAPPVEPGRRGPETSLELLEIDGIVAALEHRDRIPGLTAAALRRQHAIVTALAARTDAILPARFGTLLDVGDLRQEIARRGPAIRRALRKVRGSVQMTIRFPGWVPPPPSPRQAGTGREYLLQQAERSRATLPPGAERLRQPLERLAAAERIDRAAGPLPAAIHHLVRSTRVDEYRQRFETLRAGQRDRPRAQLSGPMPPFAFVPEILD